MRAILHIDRALKRLYNIESEFSAERFLLARKPEMPSVRSARAATTSHNGSLYFQSVRESELRVGIYLSGGIHAELKNFSAWKSPWTLEQTSAFSVAAEEVSHFHYLLQNAQVSRSVSQFELEFQGEVDKFLLTYFARLQSGEDGDRAFQDLFEQFFFRFSLHHRLTAGERVRYQDASNFARSFIRRLEPHMSQAGLNERVLKLIRRFYRVSTSEKITLSQMG